LCIITVRWEALTLTLSRRERGPEILAYASGFDAWRKSRALTLAETESGRLLEQCRELQKTARNLLIPRPRWSVSRRFIVDSFQTPTAGSFIPKGMPLHILSVFVDMRKKDDSRPWGNQVPQRAVEKDRKGKQKPRSWQS
jgi:hypothetical protein